MSKSRKDVVSSLRGDHHDGGFVYAAGPGPTAILKNFEGQTLHRWQKSFRSSFPKANHVEEPVSPSRIYWQDLHLYDSKNLLAVYAGYSEKVYGYGLVKLDSNSDVIWNYPARVHDAVTVDREGFIYTLVHEHTDKWRIRKEKGKPIKPVVDSVVKLNSRGDLVDKVNLLEAFRHSNYWAAIQMYSNYVEEPGEKVWDIFHANAVEPVTRDFAEHYDFASENDVLISLRAPDIIALLDTENEVIKWATRGFWWQPTSLKPMANGHLLVFDANGHGGPSAPSRILEVSPRTGKIVWSYSGTRKKPFWSLSSGEVLLEEKGQVIINSAAFGRFMEVNRNGEILWKYRSTRGRQVGGITQIARTTGLGLVDFGELDGN